MNSKLEEFKLLMSLLQYDTMVKNEGTLLIRKDDQYVGKAFFSTYDDAVILSLYDVTPLTTQFYKKLRKFYKLPVEFDLDVLLTDRYEDDSTTRIE